MYEVFDPKTGKTGFHVPFEWLANALAFLFNMDYEGKF